MKNSCHFCRLLLFTSEKIWSEKKSSASLTDVVIISTFQFAVRDKSKKEKCVYEEAMLSSIKITFAKYFNDVVSTRTIGKRAKEDEVLIQLRQLL